MMKRLKLPLPLSLTLLLIPLAAGRAQDVPALKQEAERALLDQMDAAVVVDCLEAAAQLKKWHDDLEALRRDLADAQKAPQATLLAEVLDFLNRRSEAFRAVKEVAELKTKLERRLKEWQDEARQSIDRARAAATAAVADLKSYLDWLDLARNPARLAKHVAEQELTKLLGQRFEAGGVSFSLKKADPSRPLFSRDRSEMVIEIDYSGVPVEVTGGVFLRPTDSAPFCRVELDLAKMKVNTDVKQMAAKKLAALGADLLAEWDLPIEVSNFEPPDFKSGKTGLACDVKIDLGALLPVNATGRVTIDTRGTPHWDAGPLTIQSPKSFKPIVLGSTSLAIHAYAGKYTPRERAVSLSLTLSAAPQGSDRGVALEVETSFTLPLRRIELKGSVKVLNKTQTLGDATVSIDFAAKKVEARLNIPGESNARLADIYSARGTFLLNEEGLFAEGKVELLRLREIRMTLAVRSDGHTRVTASDELKLFGVEVGGKLDIHIHPNLRLEATAVAAVELPDDFADGTPFEVLVPDLNVSFTVKVDTGRDAAKLAEVTFSGLGVSGSFSVPSLDELTLGRLVEEVKKKLPKMGGKVAEAGRNIDPTNKNGALRKGLKELDPTNPQGSLRQRLGNGDLSNPNNELTKAANGVGKQAGKVGKWGKQTLDRWRGKKDDDKDPPPPPPPSPEEVERADRAKRLLELADEISTMYDEEVTPAEVQKSERGRYHRQSALYVRLRHAVAGPAEEFDASLCFLIDASGYASTINTRNPSEKTPVSGGEVMWGTIDFTDLFRIGGKATAEIVLPRLENNYTDLSAELVVRRLLQDALARHLPMVTLVGKQVFEERTFAVENRSGEPVTVWVQARHWDSDAYRWLPGKPGSADAERLSIPAGATRLLTLKRPNPLPKFLGGDREYRVAAQARRVRVWAEGESGDRWDDDHHHDLWIVERNPQLGGEYAYIAEKMQEYKHVIRPLGRRTLQERVVGFRNETADTLSVRLRYLAAENGASKWQTLPPFTVKPGETVQPRRPDGLRVRASQVTFSAEGETFLFEAHQSKPLFLVELVPGSAGLRSYFGDKMGSYYHAFRVKSPGAALAP